MASPDLVMYEEEYRQIKETLQRLQVDSNAKIVFLVDKNGQQIASHGDMRDVDATSLASLTAGNVAASVWAACATFCSTAVVAEVSLSMLISQPVRREVSLAFCPFFPMASES